MTYRFLSVLVAVALLAACAGGSDRAATSDPLAADDAAAAVSSEVAEPAGAAQGPAPQPEPQPEPTAPPRLVQDPGGPPGVMLPPEVADDPAGLAEQLVAAELAIRDESVAGAALEWAGVVQQAAYRRLGRNPEWLGEVLARTPEELRPAVETNHRAGQALVVLGGSGKKPVRLPSWHIVAPAPAEELLGFYREAQDVHGVPWEYLAAIHLVETRLGRIRGTSYAGAQGPMQFMPATWAHYGEGDIHDNRDAILAAGRYLRASGAPGDMNRALFAYNRSQRYVEALSAYAEVLRADPRAYRGYYQWQVYYPFDGRDWLLGVGYQGG